MSLDVKNMDHMSIKQKKQLFDYIPKNYEYFFTIPKPSYILPEQSIKQKQQQHDYLTMMCNEKNNSNIILDKIYSVSNIHRMFQ